jgi:hypothetical protein
VEEEEEEEWEEVVMGGHGGWVEEGRQAAEGRSARHSKFQAKVAGCPLKLRFFYSHTKPISPKTIISVWKYKPSLKS